jgi:L-lactate dehydrogenase
MMKGVVVKKVNHVLHHCALYLHLLHIKRTVFNRLFQHYKLFFLLLYVLSTAYDLIEAAVPENKQIATRYISHGHATVAIVGVGVVGATIAYALMLQNISAEIILVDRNEKRCHGEVLDLSDAIPFSYTACVRQGTFRDAAQADIIIITAGARRQPGQSRIDLIKTNHHIVTTMVQNMVPINPHAIIIVVSNPVDIMTVVVQRVAGLPRSQVFGSGTLLDTQRLCGLVAQKLGVSEQSVNAYIIGEHGDSQCAAWSCARVAGIPLQNFESMSPVALQMLAEAARDKGHEIITTKEATFYGIGACVANICETIIYNQKRIIPVSCYQESLDACLSMPAIVGELGIEQVLSLPLDAQEAAQLARSAQLLKDILVQV